MRELVVAVAVIAAIVVGSMWAIWRIVDAKAPCCACVREIEQQPKLRGGEA